METKFEDLPDDQLAAALDFLRMMRARARDRRIIDQRLWMRKGEPFPLAALDCSSHGLLTCEYKDADDDSPFHAAYWGYVSLKNDMRNEAIDPMNPPCDRED